MEPERMDIQQLKGAQRLYAYYKGFHDGIYTELTDCDNSNCPIPHRLLPHWKNGFRVGTKLAQEFRIGIILAEHPPKSSSENRKE